MAATDGSYKLKEKRLLIKFTVPRCPAGFGARSVLIAEYIF
jgi:hypothetical protein